MQLVIQPLQRTLDIRAGANLLQVLREHEVPLSYSCMSGRCGTCRCRVIAGDVLDAGHEARGPLLAADLAGGAGGRHVLACQTTLTEPCTIEIPEPDEVVVHPARIVRANVLAIETLTHDIRRLRLKPNKPLAFTPGQYAQLQFTPEHARPYSMAGMPHDDELEFQVRLVPQGRVTSHIARVLKPGDSVRVSGPLGSAYLRRRHAGPMLCVAGGTGLAPVLSIVRGAVDAGMTQPIHLYVGARSARDVYGLPWLQELRERHGNLHLHVVVSSGPVGPGERAGLVTAAVEQDWSGLAGWRAYLCGAPPMVEAATLLAHRLGVAPGMIHADAFYPSGT